MGEGFHISYSEIIKLVKPTVFHSSKDSSPHILGVHCTNIIEIIEFGVALVMIYAVLLNFDFAAKFTV